MPKLQAKLTDNELQRLVQLIRVTQWNYRLETYENEALKEILKSTRKVRQEINQRLKRVKPTSQFTKERLNALADEMQHLTAATQAQITKEITQVSVDAGTASYAKYNDILSFGGRVPHFNPVTLSAVQLRSMVTNTPIGGHLLNEWVTRAFDASLQATIKTEVMAGMMQGESYRSLVKRFDDVAFPKLERNTETLVRSYVQSVNVQASKDVAAANKDLVKSWVWNSVCENRTCCACLSLDSRNEKYPIDGGPGIPLHPNCVLPETPIFSPGMRAAFVASYDGPVIEIGLTDGRRVTTTCNHMFLAPKGLIAAQFIRKGDKIFDSTIGKRILGSSPNNNNRPTLAKDVISTFSKSSGITTKRVPTASEYLHGDARFCNSDIDIIAPDSFLRDNRDVSLAEAINQIDFINSNIADRISFDTFCDFMALLFTLRDTFVVNTISSTFDTGNSESLLYDSLRDTIKFGNSALGLSSEIFFADIFRGDFDPLLIFDSKSNLFSFQKPINSREFSSRDISNIFNQFPRQIELADVLFVNKRHFSGHVYDLQSFSSLYIVNGLVSSNCRCFPEYITKTFRELGMDIDEIKQAYKPYTVRGNIDSVTGKITAGKVSTGGGRIISTGRFLGTYEDYFKIQSKAVQLQTLGPGRYELWKKGLSLSELTDKNGKLRLLKELQ